MKKFYTVIGAITISLGLSAQTANRNMNDAHYKTTTSVTNQLVSSVSSATTTVLIPMSIQTCSTDAVIIPVGTGTAYVGYLAGTNSYGDLQKAEKYTLATYGLTGPAVVSSVSAYIGKKSGAGTITAKIYADNSGAVGTLLGTSSTVSVSSVNTSSLTTFTFTTPATVTGTAFYASIDLSNVTASAGDTIAIVSTSTCTANGSGAWEQQSSNSWYQFTDATNSWGSTATMDLFIFPTVTAQTVGIKENAGNISSISLYPNPAKNDVTINYSLNTPGNVEIEIFDVTGKVVKTVSASNMQAGDHANKVDVSAFEAGVYLCSIKAEGGKSFARFVVTK